MILSDLEKRAELESEVLRLERALREAEAAYAEEKPRFDSTRKVYPQAREEEAAAIRAIGRTQDDLQLARAELLYLQGKGPRPKRWVDISDGVIPLIIEATIADQSRAEVGRLDYIED